MKEAIKFTILHCITENDLVKYHDKVKDFEKNTKYISKTISLSSIAIQGAGGAIGSLVVFSCLYEVEVTEQAYKTWKFGQNLKLT